jgi:hypothetical protein
MKGKPPRQSDMNLFEPHLRQIVNPEHPLVVFADIFPWSNPETEYSELYSDKGAPAKPVRLMAGLLILKQLFNGSDEGIVTELSRDPYFQYLCGGSVMTGKAPCSPGDLSRFRKRIGQERIRRLLELSASCQERAGTDRLKVAGGLRPGQDNFSYSLETGFLRGLLKYIRLLAGRFNALISRPAKLTRKDRLSLPGAK